MASIEAIAIKQGHAVNKLNAAATNLSQILGVEPPSFRRDHHDPANDRAMHLEGLAAWAEDVSVRVNDLGTINETVQQERDQAQARVSELEVELAATTEGKASAKAKSDAAKGK